MVNLSSDDGVRQVFNFKQGRLIIREGEIATAAYLIESGRVSVFVNTDSIEKQIEIAQLGPGEVFGEMGLIENKKHRANVRALEDTNLIVITHEMFEDRLKASDPLLRKILKLLVKRLNLANDKIYAALMD